MRLAVIGLYTLLPFLVGPDTLGPTRNLHGRHYGGENRFGGKSRLHGYCLSDDPDRAGHNLRRAVGDLDFHRRAAIPHRADDSIQRPDSGAGLSLSRAVLAEHWGGYKLRCWDILQTGHRSRGHVDLLRLRTIRSIRTRCKLYDDAIALHRNADLGHRSSGTWDLIDRRPGADRPRREHDAEASAS